VASEFLLTSDIKRYYFTQNLTLRSVTDAVTATSTSLTSATAAFSASDVGAAVTGAGIQASTTIASVTNATTVVLSQATTASASGVTVTITRTNNLGIAAFQTAINTDFASVFSPVPTLVVPGAANTPVLIVNSTLALSIPPGAWLGYNAGNWQVLTTAQLNSLFTPATV
jgi:hypothetical protein